MSVTQIRSLRNTWQCAVFHVFHVTGADIQFICCVTDNSSLDIAIIDKRVKCLENLYKFISHHEILRTLYMHGGLKEPCFLKDLRASGYQ